MLGSTSPARRSVRARLAAGLAVAVVAAGLGVVGSVQPAAAEEPPFSFSPDQSLDSRGFLHQTPGACAGYTIPPGVREIAVRAVGGNGNTGRTVLGHGGGVGGRGAVVTVDRIPVTPGQRIYTGTAPGGRPLYTTDGLGNQDNELGTTPGAGGDSAWVSLYVDESCAPESILAIAGGGGGGGDGDWNGPGGTGGDADSRGNDGSGSGSARAGRGGAPGTATAAGAGGAGGSVPDITCFCTTRGQAGTAGQRVSDPTVLPQFSPDGTGRLTGGVGGREFAGGLLLKQTRGGSGGAGLYGGGGGGASHGFSLELDQSGPLAGAGSGGGGGGATSPRSSAVLSDRVSDSPSANTQASVSVEARWATTVTVTSSANPVQPGQPVSLTATVATVNPFGTRQLTGGRVVFRDAGPDPQAGGGAVELGVVPVVVGADGRVTASVTSPGLASGTHRISAVFSGYSPFQFQDGSLYVLPSAGTVDQVVVGPQTVSFTSAAPGSAAAYGTGYTPTARSSSGLPVAVTVAPAAATVCALDPSTGQVSYLAAGTCTLYADQAGTPAFTPAARVQQSFTVAPGTPPVQQVITFTSAPPENPTFGETYTVSAVGGGSGNPVTFQAESFGTCNQTGPNTVEIRLGGLCRIIARQAAGAGFLAASATQEFGVERLPQAIEFRSTPPASLAVGQTYAVAVAVDSARLATFGTGPGSTGCSVVRTPPTSVGNAISRATVTATSPGTCVVTAQETTTDSNFAASPLITQTIPIGTQQAVAFTSAAPTGAVVGGTSTVAASGGASGQPVVLGSSTPLTCAVSGSTVTFRSSGLCVVTAEQAGTSTYAAGRATQAVVVGRGSQTVAFTSTAPAAAVVGDTYTPTTRPGISTAPLALTTTTPSTCTVRGGVVSFTAAGTCTLAADQDGDLNVTAATRVTQDVAVGKAGQALRFSAGATTAAVGTTDDPVVTGGTSSAPVVLGTTTSTTCSVSGGTVSFTAVGECVLTADRAGDDSYTAAPQVSRTVVVGPGTQALAFTSTPAAGAAVGGSYSPTLTSGASSSPVVLGTTTPAVCAVSGSAVSFAGVGTCTVTADQAGDANYTAATRVTQDVTVGQGAQSVAFTSSPPAALVGGAPYTPTLTSGASGAPVVLGSSTPLVCSVSGSAVSFVGAGTCTITADQAGDASYTAAPRVTQDVTVGMAGQSVAFTSPPPSGAVVGGTYAPVVTGGPSSAPVVLGTTTPPVCAVSGGTVTFTGAGDCVLTADQAGDADYTAAPRVSQTVSVGKAPQVITVTSTPPGSATTGVAYPVAASASSGLPVSFVGSGPCTVAPTGAGTATVTLSGVGACTVTASQAGDATRSAATPVAQTYQVGAAGSADLRVAVTPGSGVRSAGPQDVTVTVANTGSRDSGATTTQLVVTAPVADAGGAVRTGGLFGSSVLTWVAPTVAAGQTLTYTVRITPGPGLGVFGASTRGAVVDPSPFDNVALGGTVWTPAPAVTATSTSSTPVQPAAGSVPTSTTPATTPTSSTGPSGSSSPAGDARTNSPVTTTTDPQP